jgi:hypothetical protein
MQGIFESCHWELPDDWASEKAVLREIAALDRTRSPGFPYIAEGFTTIGAVLDKYGVEVVAKLVLRRIALYEESSQCADDVRIFQKREAHSMKKELEKRWRLIFGVGMLDMLVDKVLYRAVQEKFIQQAGRTVPDCPGYNFKSGGFNHLARNFNVPGRSYASFDSSSFDWRLPFFLLIAVSRFVGALCCSDTPEVLRWNKIRENRELNAATGTFRFSSGLRIEKLTPGMMLSGRFITILFNGLAMDALWARFSMEENGTIAPASWMTMGDDLLTRLAKKGDAAKFITFAAKFGIVITLEAPEGPLLEQNFCSTGFKQLKNGDFVPVPLNRDKTFFTLSQQNPKKHKVLAQAALSIAIEYAFDKEIYDHCMGVVRKVDTKLYRTQEWCQHVWTGSEASVKKKLFEVLEGPEYWVVHQHGQYAPDEED